VAEWHLQEAKVRFGELIDDTLEKGPQVVTHRGIDTAVVNSIDERHKLRDENPLTGRMYFWVKVRDSRFPCPDAARSNPASLRCSIDPLPDRHERGVRIAQAQAARCGIRLAARS
jgi:prevent-host-death family protein